MFYESAQGQSRRLTWNWWIRAQSPTKNNRVRRKIPSYELVKPGDPFRRPNRRDTSIAKLRQLTQSFCHTHSGPSRRLECQAATMRMKMGKLISEDRQQRVSQSIVGLARESNAANYRTKAHEETQARCVYALN